MNNNFCVCVEKDDEYIALIENNQTIDEAISAFIKKCVQKVNGDTKQLLTKRKFHIIDFINNEQVAMMMWAESKNHENPILILFRGDRNTSYIYDINGFLVNKKSL